MFKLGDSHYEEDESSRNARKVADHYSARSNQTLEQREASPIIHLKKLNNWVLSLSTLKNYLLLSPHLLATIFHFPVNKKVNMLLPLDMLSGPILI